MLKKYIYSTIVLQYFSFTPFSTTFERELLYFYLHYTHLKPIVMSYFVEEDFISKLQKDFMNSS